MSERTPDRLKAFREGYANSNGALGRAAYIQIAILLLGFATMIGLMLSNGPKRGMSPVFAGARADSDHHRALGAYLASKNLSEAAMEAYETYLRVAELEKGERAKLCFTVAKLAIDTERYDTALRYLYEAEMLDGESGLGGGIDKRIVLCLDKLGRRDTLRRELKHRSSAKRTALDVDAKEVILAEFAGEVITDRDLSRELEKLPASVQKEFDSPEKRTEFLKKFVAERLLLDKARRLKLDADPEIRELVSRQTEALMVRKLIRDEAQSRIHVTPEDVERFYRAELHRFTVAAHASGRYAAGASKEEAQAKAKNGRQRAVVRDGAVQGVRLSKTAEEAMAAAVMAESPGPLAIAIEDGGQWHGFHGVLKAGRVEPFEAVRARAEKMFRTQKERETVAGLLEETLAARNVKIYAERIRALEENE